MLVPLPPVLHVYVLVPDPVSVEFDPGQMVAGDALALTVGRGFTVTVTDVVPVHPAALVPVTVYVVVEAGDTTSGLLVDPVLHKYVFAPAPVSVELSPIQIAAGDALAVTVGSGFTVTVTNAVPVHPAALVPVTKYVVVEDGLTEVLPLVDPVLHT